MLRFGMHGQQRRIGYRGQGPRARDGRQRAGETQFPRQLFVLERRLGHHLADQSLGQPVNPDLAADRLRRLPAKIVQSQTGLDVPQIKFHVPAKAEQPRDLILRVTLGVGQCGDDDQLCSSVLCSFLVRDLLCPPSRQKKRRGRGPLELPASPPRRMPGVSPRDAGSRKYRFALLPVKSDFPRFPPHVAVSQRRFTRGNASPARSPAPRPNASRRQR
jgi:hypothetical protein